MTRSSRFGIQLNVGASLVALVALALSACGDDASSGTSDNNEMSANNDATNNSVNNDDVVNNDTTNNDTNNGMSNNGMSNNGTSNNGGTNNGGTNNGTNNADVPLSCAMVEDCPDNYACLDNICTLSPHELSFVETNYILESPAALSGVVSLIKGFLTGTGFFMTLFSPIDEAGVITVTYGGGDRVMSNPEGFDTYAWQFPPDTLPTFTIERFQSLDDPMQDDTWESEVFDYRLAAVFEFNGIRSTLGFEAKNAIMKATFNEDLTEIINGSLAGYITREEAESRFLNLDDPDCFFTIGLCPTFDCGVDEPLQTIADVLDCNDAELDSDIDPEIEGNDAYRAVIAFESKRVEIE